MEFLKHVFHQIPWDSPILWGAIISSSITSVVIILNGILERRARRQERTDESHGELFGSIGNMLGKELIDKYDSFPLHNRVHRNVS